ncbi:MAG: hypothetical protein DRP49_06875, partial [Spirochaetes bacterium]
MPERRITPQQLSYMSYTIASYLFFSVVMAMLKAETVLVLPGIFLFDRFNLAAMYIPALFAVSGLLLNTGRLPRRTMLILWISPVPFLTSAVMFQLISGNTSVL